MDDSYFTRDFEINPCNKILTFYQKEVGDVSCVVWDAAMVLAKYIERRHTEDKNGWPRGKAVVELGSGLGCAGLTAACLGAYVTLTDLPEVMPLLQKNIEENKDVWSSAGEVYARVLQWGSDVQDYKTPEIILLADCVYYEQSVEPLVKTLYVLADMSTEILISQEERDTDKQKHIWENFLQELKKYFDVTKIPEDEQHPEFCSPDIVVFCAKKKTGS